MKSQAESAQIWRPGASVFPFLKGRVALYAILKAAGIGPGDEVIVPGYTCVVVPAAIGYTGARPLFHDVQADTFNGDPAGAAALVGPRTRAIIVQHTYGAPADIRGLVELCRDRGILVIEDCAHAMCAATGDGAVGELGHAAFGSLQWSKPVTTGLGGLARANDAALASSLRRLVADSFDEPTILQSLSLLVLTTAYRRCFRPGLFWAARDAYRWLGARGFVSGSSSPAELLGPAMPAGYAKRFGRLRSRQISGALDALPAASAHRTLIAGIYERWADNHGFHRQRILAGSRSSHLRFPLLVSDRDGVLAAARAARIEIGDWFNAPLHPADASGEAFGYEPGRCPVADRISRQVINLPTHRRIDPAEAARILRFLDDRCDLIVRASGERIAGGPGHAHDPLCERAADAP
ncbi:MAG: DegT/DnrJ/EryC1/StrS family aminotransferase [Candidatus Krumholzibacteriia bacterium]